MWREKCTTEQVPCTTYVTECVREKVPYTTTRRALDELVAHELACSGSEEDGLRRYRLLDSIPVGKGTALTEPSAISTEVPKWQRSGNGLARPGKGSGKARTDVKPNES